MIDDDDVSAASLNSDDLGDVGEAEFQTLAAKGPLIVNKAIRDRAGWDFVIHGQADGATGGSLDGRELLWTSYVQVKAAWNDRKPTVRLSLSAAEKLAKHRAATFIAVLLYDRLSRDCSALYLVELTGDRLGMILKALRDQQRQGIKALKDIRIHLSPLPEERLARISGPAIRERLAEVHRRVSPEGYETFKTRELKTIGWAQDRLRGTITLHDIDPKGLADVLLGRRPWRASLSDFVERRFDIDLPARNSPSGQGDVRFSPEPQARCEVSVSWKGSGGRVVFSGDHNMIVLPGPKGLESHSRLTFGAFTIDRGGGQIILATRTAEATPPRMTLAAWRRAWRLLDAFHRHGTNFVVRSPLFKTPLTWSFAEASPAFERDTRQALMAVQAAVDLEEELGLDLGAITMEELAPWAKGLVMARYFGRPGRPQFTFSIERPHGTFAEADRSPQDGVYIDVVDLGDKRIAFAVRLRMAFEAAEGVDRWFSSKGRRLDLQRIDRTPEAFRNFVEEAKTLAGLEKVFLGDIDDGFLREALGEITPF